MKIIYPTFSQFLLFIFLLSSCKKDNNSKPIDDNKNPHIYMSGFYENNAVYWRDKTVKFLGPAYNTTGIFKKGTDVYVLGNINFPWQGGSANQAVYWKNDNIIKLEFPPSYANSIFIQENDVYVAGMALINDNYVAVYWKNGTIQPLSQKTLSTANGIIVNGNDVYVAGSESGNACLWKNNQKIVLDQSSESVANAVFVFGDDIYVAGSTTNQWLHRQAVYWKNGNLNILIPGNLDTQVIDVNARSIAVFENNIYISGWINNIEEVLWENGNMKFLNNPAKYVNLANNSSNISLYNNQAYISHNTSSYWKNDSTFIIGTGYASGITVSDE